MARRLFQLNSVRLFESTLLDFFGKAGREHLPWRREGISAYEVWVSEIMLQQTQVSRVLSYYGKFFVRFPDVESLARASWEEFLPYYAGLGYYSRGRNMLRTAKIVVETFGGEFPRDIKTLQTLPGVGDYTASAIASFAYDVNTLAWDTNLRRVIGRFFFGTKYFEKIQEERNGKSRDKKNVAAKDDWRNNIGNRFSVSAKTLNAAIMDFGSAICIGKPKCAACPLALRCVYSKEKGERESTTKQKQLRVEGKKERVRNYAWKDARVEVTLHENHRKYFSSLKGEYRPFLVPSSHNTRAGIKAWFRERYGLDVSVRPPHEKILVENVPILFVNVQILSGTHVFVEFSKEDLRKG
ncbi:MAG: A/G-specific adenine glycosylase [Candidatus Moraniibacteriota bacterium]|nr:MAG: A/G-specific adenine glycosylase [Candidatus Moranbacteria bacterium]